MAGARSNASSTAATRWRHTASTATRSRRDSRRAASANGWPSALRFAQLHYNADVAYLYEGAEVKPDPAAGSFDPQENLLYFIEKSAPKLAPWQRELVRIVRKISQYFYPQRLTRVANEGAATFWHYTLLHELYDNGEVDDGFMLEWLSNHSDVVTQPSFDAEHFRGINPYALGFSIFRDIRRICEQPTEEDREWFPRLAATDWVEAVHFAMANFKDESLIEQYLSPKVMRDLRLFVLADEESDRSKYAVRVIHNEQGYARLRQTLAAQYRPEVHTPPLAVTRFSADGDRALLLQHRVERGRLLDAATVTESPRLHQGALAVRCRARGSRRRRQPAQDPPHLIDRRRSEAAVNRWHPAAGHRTATNRHG